MTELLVIRVNRSMEIVAIVIEEENIDEDWMSGIILQQKYPNFHDFLMRLIRVKGMQKMARKRSAMSKLMRSKLVLIINFLVLRITIKMRRFEMIAETERNP